jgi:hypothetical protein
MADMDSRDGYPEIRPRNVSDIVDFLRDERAEYYGILWNPYNESIRCDLAYRVNVLPPDTTRNSNCRFIELYLIRDDTDREYYRVERNRIDHLVAYERPPNWFLNPPIKTSLRGAKQQWRLAKVRPHKVSAPSLLDLIKTDDRRVQYICLKTVRTALESTGRSEDFESLIPVAKTLATEAKDPELRKDALGSLVTFADTSPEDIVPFLPELIELLDPDCPRVTLSALQCLIKLADYDPDKCSSYTSKIDWCLRAKSFLIRYQMLTFMAKVASGHPETVRPYTDEVVADCALDIYPRSHVSNALSVVGHVSKSYPGDVVDAVSFIVGLVDGTPTNKRKNATGILSNIARLYGNELTEHIPTFIRLLSDPDPDVRRNSSLAVSLIAEDFPDLIRKYLLKIVATLEDSNPVVRENICWTLGHLESRESKEVLLEHQQRESEPDVLNALSWALTQIESDLE